MVSRVRTSSSVTRSSLKERGAALRCIAARCTRRQKVGPGRSVLVNVYSSLAASAPKLMVDYVSDDYAEVGGRRCSCPLGALRLRDPALSARCRMRGAGDGQPGFRQNMGMRRNKR
jgi:hypothetical protein